MSEKSFEEAFGASVEKFESEDTGAEVQTQEEVIQEEPIQEETPEVAAEVPEVEEPENISETKPQFTDESFFEYFREKTGREASSFDDLIETREAEPLKYANDEMATIDKWSRETGRPPRDWYRMQDLDVENMSAEQKIKMKMSLDNPELSASEVNLLFKREYKKANIDDDLIDDDDKARLLEDNQYVDIKLKREAAAADKDLRELKDQYNVPVKQEKAEEDFDSDGFRSSWGTASKNIEGFQFELDRENTFDWNITENEQKFFETPVEPEAWLNQYVKEDGSWDMQQWASDVYILNNLEKIIRNAAASKAGQEVENMIDEVKGTKKEEKSAQDQRTNISEKTSSLAKAMFQGRR